MSFLKITDPKKRDLIVAEFLETKRNIQNQQLATRLGEQDALVELTKQYKPVTDVLAEIKDQQPQGLTIQNYLNPPAIEAAPEAPTGLIGNIAANYLKKYTTKEADKTQGIYSKDGRLYIGDTMATINDDDILVGDKEYQGTPGLWELLVMKEPDESVFTEEDYENYREIMTNTNAMKRGNDVNSNTPKASKGYKWKHLLKPIWDGRRRFEGEGVSPIILPSDPNALLERFDLLMSSKRAGNTGVRNELVSICDELKRQNIFDVNLYKKIISSL